MKIKSIQKIATVYFYIETDDELFPEYRRSLSGQWEHSMGESWETWYDDGALERMFQEYLAGQPQPTTDDLKKLFKDYRAHPASLEDGVYHIEYIDDHLVRLTKKASS